MNFKRRMKIKAARSYHRHLVAGMWREYGRPVDMSSGALWIQSIPSNTDFSLQIDPKLSMALVKINGKPTTDCWAEAV